MLETKTYKNYKELCGAMGWKVTTGEAKQKQISSLDTFCKYHKEGNKFVIEEITGEVVAPTDGRQDDYVELIENLILNLCYHESYQPNFDGSAKFSMSKIARAVGLFNENFAHCRRMIGKTSKCLNTNIDTTKEYFDTVERSASGKIETALKNLDKKATVSWNRIVMVVEVEELKQFSIQEQENGTEEVVKHTIEKHRKATDEEVDYIRDSRKRAYIEYGVKDAKEAKFSPKCKEINHTIKTSLLKKNISYYYEAYEIRFNPKYVEYDLQQFNLNDREKEAMRKTLKEEFSMKIYENADKKNIKALGKPNRNDKKAYRWGDKYMKDYNTLNSNMIVTNENIVDNVYKTKTTEALEEMLIDVETEDLIKLIEKRQKRQK